MLTGEDFRQKLGALRVVAVLDQQRSDHDDAVIVGAGDAVAFELLDHDDLLAGGEAHAAMFDGPAGAQPALRGKLVVPHLVVAPVQALGRIAQFLRVVVFHPVPHRHTERRVRQRIEGHDPAFIISAR
jgi:hypothetical protein